jgi:hypothetical protein
MLVCTLSVCLVSLVIVCSHYHSSLTLCSRVAHYDAFICAIGISHPFSFLAGVPPKHWRQRLTMSAVHISVPHREAILDHYHIMQCIANSSEKQAMPY